MRYRQLPFLLAIALLATQALPANAGELWMVSTRAVCLAEGGDPHDCDVWKLDADQCWVPASVEELVSTADPAVPMTIFLHGNRADACRAVEMGWQVYERLSCEAGTRPFRQVIWSWPSDRLRGPRRDAEAKAARSDAEAMLLAKFLNPLRKDARVNLFGYSFGARIATGALELLAGGQVAGRVLADRRTAPRTPMRAMLVAAAEDTDWLLPCAYHGQALSTLERALVTCNPCDRALRFYPRISCGAAALGAVGAYCPPTEGDCRKLETVNVACEVGRKHDWDGYFAASDVQCRLAWYAFLAAPTVADHVAAK
jgi:pimeloyl-ACP methyl ester carboxylesterase